MNNGCIMLVGLTLTILISEAVWSQPRLVTSSPVGYRVGDRIDPGTSLLDRNRSRVRLVDLVGDDTQIALLIVFGGALLEKPPEPFRGELWCRDSFDDLGLQRALVHYFKNQPVQFIAVAIPPVYGPDRYGYPDHVFLQEPDTSSLYQQALSDFIEATENLRENSLLPFESIYYDPRFHLAHNNGGEHDGPGIKLPKWHGKMKWHLDPRLYGTPIIWVLGPGGEILREPFFGNDYDAEPPQVEYEFHDVRRTIEDLLTSSQ